MNEVEKALQLWVDLTGIDPNAKSFTSKTWDIVSMNEELKEALVLDDTQLTTLMLLDTFATDYLDNREFSVNELLSNYDTVFDYLKKSKDLYSILRSDEMNQKVADFQNWLHQALDHYEASRSDVLSMAESRGDMSFLRRDAFRSLQNLELHQFHQGEPDESTRPKYVETVHEFYNINSLVKMMCSDRTMSGVSLNLIRDPMGLSSYFVFGIKNGENILILTDKPKYAHPLQKYMTRKPERRFADRISKHHFPYDLLDLDYDKEGNPFISPRDTKEVVLYQEALHPLKKIKDLHADEIIWTILVFSLIEERFWRQGQSVKELSYTGEMVVNNSVIEEQMKSVSIQTPYEKLEVSPLCSEDMTADKMLDEWEIKPTQKNKWMEERYEDKVPDSVLNLVGDDSDVKFLTDGSVRDVSLEEYAESQRFIRPIKIPGLKLEVFDGASFGTKEQIEADRRWVARYNKAVIINSEAKKEFNERQKDIVAEYRELITKNAQALLGAVAKGNFEAPTYVHGGGFGEVKSTGNILTVKLTKYHDSALWSQAKVGTMMGDGSYGCYVNGTKATVIGWFRPKTPEALALLCGCDVSDLPDVLQHWTLADIYSGNSILDRIDPMEWVVKNPWSKLKLDVGVFLSKKAYNELRKSVGLPPNRIWDKEE